jgi:mannose-1-phosphate guanylyltransferase
VASSISSALVLTAGLGTRLRPLTEQRAKPAIPVAGEPMIRRILAWTASHGVTDVVMNLHHQPHTITAVVGDGRDLGVRARYSWEVPRILGSAGGPRLALPIVGAATFFLINGDTLTDVNLSQMAAAHRRSGALVTLALVPNRDFTRYGGVLVDDQDVITGFVPRGPAANGSWHFIGVQVVEGSVFSPIPAGEKASSIGGVYDRLLNDPRRPVRGYRGDWQFFDVGTPDDYLRTTLAFSTAGSDVGRHTTIDAAARVTRSVLWDDVEVGPGASLTECIVTDGVRVPAGAVYERAIVMADGDQLMVTPIESH